MAQIQLTKELLSKDLFAAVLFIVYTAPTAMGNEGMVRFITRDDTEYFFNYLEDDLKCPDIEKIFPPIAQFKRDSVALEEWKLVYLGAQTSIAIKAEVFCAFKEVAKEYPVKNYMLFQNWRKVVKTVLESQ